MVTGVSTGALIAPFAFLGPDYDLALRDFVIHVDDFPFDYGFSQRQPVPPVAHKAAA